MDFSSYRLPLRVGHGRSSCVRPPFSLPTRVMCREALLTCWFGVCMVALPCGYGGTCSNAIVTASTSTVSSLGPENASSLQSPSISHVSSSADGYEIGTMAWDWSIGNRDKLIPWSLLHHPPSYLMASHSMYAAAFEESSLMNLSASPSIYVVNSNIRAVCVTAPGLIGPAHAKATRAYDPGGLSTGLTDHSPWSYHTGSKRFGTEPPPLVNTLYPANRT